MLSEMSGLTVTQVNLSHAPYTMIAGAIGAVMLTILAIVFKDYGEEHRQAYLLENKESEQNAENMKVNIFYALAPLVPLVILVIGGTSLQKNARFRMDEDGCTTSDVNWFIICCCDDTHFTGQNYK